MTDVIVAPRVEDLTSDTEAVASGGWFQIRPSVPYVAGGQWVQDVWSDPIPLVGVAVTVKLDPLASVPYELRGEIPDGESGVKEIHEFRIVTASGSPVGWETFTQVTGPGGSPILPGADQARLTALEAAVLTLSGGSSNLAAITDMSAAARTFNAQTTTTNMRTNIGAAASNNAVFTGTVTIPDAALEIADTNGLTAALAAKAPLASPALTGTPTAPTAAPGTNTTQVSTTAFVTAAVTAAGGIAIGTTAGTAADAATVVTVTGAQTVAGVKTFSSQPAVPTATVSTAPIPKAQFDSYGTPCYLYINYSTGVWPSRVVPTGAPMVIWWSAGYPNAVTPPAAVDGDFWAENYPT